MRQGKPPRPKSRYAQADRAEILRAQRRAEVVRLRAEQGLSFPAIGAKLGVHATTAWADWDEAMRLDYQPPEVREAAKRAARMRLDEAERRLLEVLNRVHYAHAGQSGKLILGPDGEPLIDDGPIVQAVRAWVRLMAERNLIDGVYAPTQVVDVTPEAVAAAVDARCRELGIDPERARELARAKFGLIQGDVAS